MDPETVRTCQNCAHAKIRCHRSSSDASCDRCRRLDKECVFRTARRRNAPPRDSRTDALASIESKLDQLLSVHISAGSVTSISRTATPDCQDVITSGVVTLQAAEYYVELYKSSLTPHFPFVVLSPDVSAQGLRREKPLLFQAILAAAAYGDVPVQRELAYRVRNLVAEHIAGRSPMSFELLQTLLVSLAWSQFHPRPTRYSQFLQLAISSVVDQRLDRPPRTSPWKTNVGACVSEHFEQPPPQPASRSSEVQRAVAGCYYLSSSVATLMQKLNTFRCNSYIEECCKSLSVSPECPADAYLYSIVQLQRTMESIDEPLGSFAGSPTTIKDLAVSRYASVQMSLKSWRANAPVALSEDYLQLMLFHTVELHNVQMRLFGHPPLGTPYDLRVLNEGFKAATSLLGLYLSLPLRREIFFNNTEWMQLNFALTVATKLMFAAADPSIREQTKGLRDSLDLSGILRQAVLRLGALVSAATDDQGEVNIFMKYQHLVKRLQTWFEERYSQAQPGAQAVDVSGIHGQDGSHMSQPLEGGLLLPNLQSLEAMAAYDLQLTTFFPELQMDDSLGDWAIESGGF